MLLIRTIRLGTCVLQSVETLVGLISGLVAPAGRAWRNLFGESPAETAQNSCGKPVAEQDEPPPESAWVELSRSIFP